MNRQKIAGVFLATALALAISGGTALFARRARVRAEAEVAERVTKNITLQSAIHSLDTGWKAPPENPAGPEEVAPPSPSGATKPLGQSDDLRELNHRERKDTVIATHPELLALYTRARRAEIHRDYTPFYRALSLSPQAIQRLEKLREKDWEDEMDLTMIQYDAKLTPNDAALRQARKTLAEEVRTGQKAILGVEGYEKFQAFERAQAIHGVTDEVAAFLLFSDPLNGAQSSRLTQLLADSSASYRNGGVADWYTVDWESVITRSQEFLSATQLNAVRAEAQKWRAVRLLGEFFTRQGHVY